MQVTESRQLIVYQLPTLKGICMLSVVLIHVADPWRMKPDHWLTGIVYLVNTLLRFSVPLFFLFSGFYLSINPKNECAIRFYRRTLKFLIVPYILYSLIYSLPQVWERDNWAYTIAENLLLGTACYHLWFIPAMIRFYILQPFLNRWYRTSKYPGRLVIAGLLLPVFWPALSFAIQFIYPQAWAPFNWLLGPLTYVGFFLLGYYVRDHSEKIRITERRAVVLPSLLVWIAAATAITLLARAHVAWYWTPIHNSFALVLNMAAFMLILALITRTYRSDFPFLEFLHSFGLHSYGIYYLHPVCLYLFRWVLTRGIGIPLENPLLYLLLFPLTSLTTLQIARIVARLPAGRYLT
jgi:surface polysaccharide O-acyltransferase-like enzyme